MLSFFTDPYPNELLYSALSRYHYYIGNLNYKDTNHEVYGKKKHATNIYFGAYINNLVELLGGIYNEEELIYNHTIFPFYKPFLSENSINDRINKMKISSPNFGFLINSCFFKDKRLYYCPQCVQEDVQKYGEAYFHREHQLNGIIICSKHKLILRAHDDIRMGGETLDFIKLNYKEIGSQEKNKKNLLLSAKIYDRMCEISELSYELFNNYISALNRHTILKAYKNVLIEKEFKNLNGRIKIKQLKEEMINYYGEGFLKGTNCNIEVESKSNWIDYIFTENDCYINPLKHILVINFLGKNISDMINFIDNSYIPFGEGPWPCMNKFCDHYKQDIIENVTISRFSKTEEIAGKFKCDICGYKYSRKLSNINEYEFKFNTIQWGKLWLNKFEEYVKEDKYSISELSKIMGCHRYTVYRKLNDLKRRNKVNINIKIIDEKKLDESKKSLLKKIEQNQIEIKDIVKLKEFSYIDMYDPEWLLINFHYERQEKNSTEEYVDLYKKQILELLQLNPGITRTELYHRIRYDILIKNDPTWLEDNLPKPDCSKGFKVNAKDWESQDKKLLDILKTKYKEICSCDKVVKITKKFFKREIGEISITKNSLNKMPLSSVYIDSIIDTPRSYRIKWYKKHIKEEYDNYNDVNIDVIPYFFHDFYKYKKDESLIKELEEYLEELKNKS